MYCLKPQSWCVDGVRSCTDEFHNPSEIFIGMNFPVKDLLNIQHELYHSYTHDHNVRMWPVTFCYGPLLFNVINVIRLYGAGPMYLIQYSYLVDWHPTVEDVTSLARHKPICCYILFQQLICYFVYNFIAIIIATKKSHLQHTCA